MSPRGNEMRLPLCLGSKEAARSLSLQAQSWTLYRPFRSGYLALLLSALLSPLYSPSFIDFDILFILRPF